MCSSGRYDDGDLRIAMKRVVSRPIKLGGIVSHGWGWKEYRQGEPSILSTYATKICDVS